MRSDFPPDDHSAPALLLRDDGRLMPFYAKHDQEPRMYYRLSTRPRDASAWEREQSYTLTEGRFTYANPLSSGARGVAWSPTWCASDDGGRTWGTPRHFLERPGHRPYVKYASNAEDTIHFAFTAAHPGERSSVDPERGTPGTSGHHELYRGTTADGGRTWTWAALTAGSAHDHLRPVVPARHPEGTFVLCLRGRYTTHQDYATEVVAFRRPLHAPIGASSAGVPR